jgi:hypothetical protein
MATNIVFLGSVISETDSTELRMFYNAHNEIYIEINSIDDFPSSFICLDRETAIKLHKELKKQISYIQTF